MPAAKRRPGGAEARALPAPAFTVPRHPNSVAASPALSSTTQTGTTNCRAVRPGQGPNRAAHASTMPSINPSHHVAITPQGRQDGGRGVQGWVADGEVFHAPMRGHQIMGAPGQDGGRDAEGDNANERHAPFNTVAAAWMRKTYPPTSALASAASAVLR